jgi:hypothetical protein
VKSSLFHDTLRTSLRQIGLEILLFTSYSISCSHFFSLWQLPYRGHCSLLTCKFCYRSYSTSMPAAQTQGWSAPQGYGRCRVSRHCSPWGQCGHRHVVSTYVYCVTYIWGVWTFLRQRMCLVLWESTSASFVIKNAPYSCVLVGVLLLCLMILMKYDC